MMTTLCPKNNRVMVYKNKHLRFACLTNAFFCRWNWMCIYGYRCLFNVRLQLLQTAIVSSPSNEVHDYDYDLANALIHLWHGRN